MKSTWHYTLHVDAIPCRRSCWLPKRFQLCRCQCQLLLFPLRPPPNARHDMSHWIEVCQLWKLLQRHLSQSWSCEYTPPPVAFAGPNLLQIQEHFTFMKSSSLTELWHLPSDIWIFLCWRHTLQYHHNSPQEVSWCKCCWKCACPFILTRLTISKQRVWLTGNPRCQSCTERMCLVNLLNRLEVSNVTYNNLRLTVLFIQLCKLRSKFHCHLGNKLRCKGTLSQSSHSCTKLDQISALLPRAVRVA